MFVMMECLACGYSRTALNAIKLAKMYLGMCVYIYICIVKQMRGLLKSLLISWDPLVFGTLSTMVNWAIEKIESFHC